MGLAPAPILNLREWFARYRTAFLSYAASRGFALADVALFLSLIRENVLAKHCSEAWGDPDDAAYEDVRACETEFVGAG